MVKSKLNKSIYYQEIKDINKETREYFKEYYKKNDAITYNIILFGIPIEITFGIQNDKFKEQNIIYYPIYLVIKNITSYQLGIYEVDSKKLLSNLDDDGNLIFDNLDNTLFFSYSKEFIEKKIKETGKIKDGVKESEKESEKEAEKEAKKTKKTEKAEQEIDDEIEKLLLTQQFQEKSEEIEELLIPSWIKTFLKDKEYLIQDTIPNGDCFFEAVSKGLQTIGKNISIEELRIILSSKATQELFDINKLLYEEKLSVILNINEQISEFEEEKKKLNQDIHKTKNHSKQEKIRKEYKNIKELIANLQTLHEFELQEFEEFKRMEDINNLEQFKSFIQSRLYWADTWAISTIERILNIKFVILSEYAYESKDFANVLQCGQLNDTLERFEPSHYIILAYTGNHYKLVKKKNLAAFTFDKLSKYIKDLIIDKCLERNAGPWYIIREFREYNKTDLVEVEPELYDDDIVFQFYSKSDAKPYPGKGSGEKIPANRIKEFTELSRIKDWRRKLTNSWNGNEFKIDGKRWGSVEHYYQGSKFKKDNYEFYTQFSLDSNSEISKNIDVARAAGDKKGIYKTQQIRNPKILIDSDFQKRENDEIKIAEIAKFNQNPDLKILLLKTINAKLVHYVRSKPAVPAKNLMRLRLTFKK